MIAATLLLAAFAATSLMTAFSYFISESFRKLYRAVAVAISYEFLALKFVPMQKRLLVGRYITASDLFSLWVIIFFGPTNFMISTVVQGLSLAA